MMRRFIAPASFIAVVACGVPSCAGGAKARACTTCSVGTACHGQGCPPNYRSAAFGPWCGAIPGDSLRGWRCGGFVFIEYLQTDVGGVTVFDEASGNPAADIGFGVTGPPDCSSFIGPSLCLDPCCVNDTCGQDIANPCASDGWDASSGG